MRVGSLMPRLLGAGALTTLLGCGGPDYETIPTFPVRGRVQVNGQPAEGAIVRFHPLTPQPGAEFPLTPSGRTEADGQFELTTYEGSDGAPAGEYAITVVWPDPTWRPPGGGPPPLPPDRLKGAYADPERSRWKATVNEGNNLIDPIDIVGAELLRAGASRPASSR
jgi:hypothetical protein